MISGFIGGLIIAFFLSLLKIDRVLLKICQLFTTKELTVDHYYIVFGLLGVMSKIF